MDRPGLVSATVSRIFLCAVAVGALHVGLATMASAEPAACTGPIKFGLTTALTGPVALLGVQARNGVEFTLAEINAAGGIAGQKVELTVEDTGGSSTDAVNAINRVIETKPLVIFGSMISPHVFAQTELIKKAEVPFIVGATNAQITSQGVSWLFRTHVHDGQIADIVPTYLVETLHKKKPGIIVVADDYGLGASKGIQAKLASMGLKPVAATSYAPTDKDVSAQILQIQDNGADSIIMFGRPGDVAIVMRQLGDLGSDLLKIGNSSTVAQTMLNNLPAREADGAYGLGGMIPQTSTDPKIQAWSKAVLDRYKVPADNFTVSYADSVHLLKQVIEKVGCDRAAIRDALAAVKDFQGMLISYTADAKGDLAHMLGVYRIKGKTPELVGLIKEPGF